jgi:hypothetical protein
MNANNPDIYVYKLVTDNGGAPCVFRGKLSLAICKPKIRSSARRGSLVFGFGAKHYGERLIYIAEVSEKLSDGAYYRDNQYAARPDCIYKDVNGRPARKSSARYHSTTDERRRDVGFKFERANALLSDDFRYFGAAGTAEYKKNFPAIKRCVERLKQGHRRYHSAVLRSELLALKREAWKQHSEMKVGPPTDASRVGLCNIDCGSRELAC